MNATGGGGDRDRIERAYYALRAEEWGLTHEDARSVIESGEGAIREGLRRRMRGQLAEMASEVAVCDALNAVVDAWESLPGGRYYSGRAGIARVEAWLVNRMNPAIDAARAALGREVPE